MAIKNPTATQAGGVNQLVHIDTMKIYDALPEGVTAGVDIAITHIGGATTAVQDSRAAYATKALRPILITVSTNNDALVNGVAGWYNRSGQTAAVGKYVIAVAA
jgi:hypothetical protein